MQLTERHLRDLIGQVITEAKGKDRGADAAKQVADAIKVLITVGPKVEKYFEEKLSMMTTIPAMFSDELEVEHVVDKLRNLIDKAVELDDVVVPVYKAAAKAAPKAPTRDRSRGRLANANPTADERSLGLNKRREIRRQARERGRT